MRNMGPASTSAMVRACAQHAEALGIDDIWVTDHVAIPKEESAGSGGRYLDPLATLAFLAAATSRIGLAVGVLVAPYRPALITAKWVATIQELSEGRLTLGVGVGWMDAEFRAVGVDRSKRGAITDETLAFVNDAFAYDEIESNGQRFLFLPRPPRPPIVIGGSAPQAIDRAVRFGDGWMPTRLAPAELANRVSELSARFSAAGKAPPMVVPLTTLPIHDSGALAHQIADYRAAGATGLVHFTTYDSEDDFARCAETLVAQHNVVVG